MSYSENMGIEIPQWVITTKSSKTFWNAKANSFTNILTEDCLFASLTEANEKMKDLDFGYVVKTARKYMDLSGTNIRLS